MTIQELLTELDARTIRLRRDNDNLVIAGDEAALDTAFVEQIRAYKSTLLEITHGTEIPYLVPSAFITPEMLPLIQLGQQDIDRIVRTVPTGAGNVQDIYPLAPLQEGILFHHLMSGEGDPYLLASQYSFDTRNRLDNFLRALQAVIDRHDILRTAVLWEDICEPVQVVYRNARLQIQEVEVEPEEGDAAEQLYVRFGPRKHRIDIRQAPLLHAFITYDREKDHWILLLLLHHLAGDHTTLDLVQQEIQAHLLGKQDLLPSPLPFRNLVAQARLGISREEHEAFFRQMLGDVDEPTAPFGLLNVHGGGEDIEQASLLLDENLARRIRANARRLHVSAASLCHVAWARVLGQVSGRDDVVFGTVLFGRMQGGEGSDRALGLFINTLPVRIVLNSDGVEASVRSTHALLANLMRHEHASLALVQRCSAVPAPLPLFSALLNYRYNLTQSHSTSAHSSQAWIGMRGLRGEERTNYPLVLSIDDQGQGFQLTTQTLGSVNSGRICNFMHVALQELIDSLETCPKRLVSTLPILSAEERHRVLYEWNDTRADFPRDKCIHELFEEQVSRNPDATAVVFEEQELSYRELNRRSNQLAHHLKDLGAGPDKHVAICMDRGFEMIVSLLAILKAGAAYVPLDPAYPVDRLAFMIEDSSPVVLLTQTHLCDLFDSIGTPFISVDAPLHSWHNAPDTNIDPASIGLTPQHLAYIIYTSGSTGLPKGVLIEHRAFTNLICWHGDAFMLGDNEACASISSIGFDAAGWEIWSSLCSGAKLILVSSQLIGNVEQLLIWWKRQKLRVAFLPTALAEIALSSGHINEQLRVLLIGGDWLHDIGNSQRAVIVNNYGPTEATVVSTSGAVASLSKIFPIGRPIANAYIYILDSHGEPVPIGVTGELYIGGAGVARGYLNRPELTAERFVPDPYAPEAGARMYRTGDLGRWLPDGNIEFLGRSDFQVKIRGFRIELGEIEARLMEHAAVREAVVIAREDTPGDKRLVAYYTSGGQEDIPGAEQLRNHLSTTLPEYMVPAAYVQLDSLPLTPNGKLDRKALPAPESDAYSSPGYEPPQTDTEAIIAHIWAELLKLERVGRNDNFFELGGHSLLAVQVINLLEQTGISIQVSDLFTNSTVASLSSKIALRGKRPAEMADKAICVNKGRHLTPLFLTPFGPDGLWYVPALGRHLSSDLPLYGLPPQIGHTSSLKTIQGMAARMVGMIREVQSCGPYKIAGWSFGGILAYEIAYQLLGADQEVSFIGMFDTGYARAYRDEPQAIIRRLHAARDHKDILLFYAFENPNMHVLHASEVNTLKDRWKCVDFDYLVSSCKASDLLPAALAHLGIEEIRAALLQYRIDDLAQLQYNPPPLPMPINLFVASDGDPTYPTRGWDTVLNSSQIKVQMTRGTHHSIMRSPNIQHLGSTLMNAIANNERIETEGSTFDSQDPALITLQTGMRRAPTVVCIPGAGGNVASFIELASQLDKTWTVLGLQPRGLDGTIPHSSISAAVDYYLPMLFRASDTTPMCLLGHSFGGWIAFALAQRLVDLGRPAPKLLLIDSDAPDGPTEASREYDDIEVINNWLDTLELTLDHPLTITRSIIDDLSPVEQIKMLHECLVSEGLVPRRSKPELLKGLLATFAASLRTRYTPEKPYDWPVLLLQVDGCPKHNQADQFQSDDLIRKWKKWAPTLASAKIPGNHMTALKSPYVVSVTTFIRKEMLSI